MVSIHASAHFTRAELACPHCGKLPWGFAELNALEDLRLQCGFPLPISSGYRCPTHNAAVSTTGEHGPHTVFAVDVALSGTRALTLVQSALALGWTGVGVQQRGLHGNRFIHLDRLPAADPSHPRPWIWSYA